MLEVKLSLTHTLCAADVGSEARFAGASVGAQSVETLTILAQVAHHTTLINIWMEKQEKLAQDKLQLNYRSLV